MTKARLFKHRGLQKIKNGLTFARMQPTQCAFARMYIGLLTQKMKRTLTLTFILCISFQYVFSQGNPSQKGYMASVLIENFSSEGCSSCPIADDFLKEVIHKSDSNRLPVYVLDYHVDVWNRSGWVDRFADSNHTKRQMTYIGKFSNPAMYTPQAFLNGEITCQGFNKKDIGNFINKTLSKPSGYFLRTAAYQHAADSITIDYTIWGDLDSCEINFAIAHNELVSDVTAGENAGKILHHHNVVEFFKTERLPATPNAKRGMGGNYTGRAYMKILPGFDLSKVRLISFVQHQNSWRVLASDQLIVGK